MRAGGLLVVEDDDLVAWALQKVATSLKVPVQVADTGAAAREYLRNHPCELAIVDVRLPDADGIDLLPEFSSLSPGTRFIVITADATPSHRERALRQGAWQFVEKPFEYTEMSRLIEDCCTHGSRRAHERRLCRAALRLELLADTDAVIRRSFGGTAVDVSRGGLRLQTSYPLQPGQRLRVRPMDAAPGGGQDVPADAEARVVWTQRVDEGVTAGLAYLA